MIVLGFDTATTATAVALRLAEGETLRARDDPGVGERPGHTARLLPLVRELVERAAIGWDELERIAVGVGPGTFTGLRVGVATARGLAQALAIDLVGVSTPQALAVCALAAREPIARATERELGVLSVIDARRGEAFVAPFARSAAGAAAVRELAQVQALAPEEIADFAAAADRARSWRAVGDGAVRFRTQLEAAGIEVAADGSPLHRVDAGALCELALAAPHGEPEAVLPDYRRRPDAEIALEDAQQ